jgi:RHS repeat-associated protein
VATECRASPYSVVANEDGRGGAAPGLTYFGKRYLSPQLGRWITPDPLAVHVPGQADFNLYAYVKGMALRATDPVGLECGQDQSCEQTASSESGESQYSDGTTPSQNQSTYAEKQYYQQTAASQRSERAYRQIQDQILNRPAQLTNGSAPSSTATNASDPPTGIAGPIVFAVAWAGAKAGGASDTEATLSGQSWAKSQEATDLFLFALGATAGARADYGSLNTGVKPAQMTQVSPGAAAEAPTINIQKQAGHVPGTPQYANRVAGGKLTSSFFDAKQAESVTVEAWQKGTPLGTDGKMRLFDFGKPVGVGPGGGGYQTQIGVSIDSGGKIHGTPWGPVFQGPLPQ